MMRSALTRLHRRVVEYLLPSRASQERISERIVEYPFVIKNIDGLERGKILDVGCYGSCLTTILAALGHEVHAIDIKRFPIRYPGVEVVEGDVRQTIYPSEFFDAVVAISTIEHIGVKSNLYGIRYEDSDGDKKAVREMARVLKPGGKMIVTVPYGKSRRTGWRVYNDCSLKELLSGLKTDTMEFFALKNGCWIQVSEDDASEINQVDGTKNPCVVLLELSKEDG